MVKSSARCAQWSCQMLNGSNINLVGFFSTVKIHSWSFQSRLLSYVDETVRDTVEIARRIILFCWSVVMIQIAMVEVMSKMIFDVDFQIIEFSSRNVGGQAFDQFDGLSRVLEKLFQQASHQIWLWEHNIWANDLEVDPIHLNFHRHLITGIHRQVITNHQEIYCSTTLDWKDNFYNKIKAL